MSALLLGFSYYFKSTETSQNSAVKTHQKPDLKVKERSFPKKNLPQKEATQKTVNFKRKAIVSNKDKASEHEVSSSTNTLPHQLPLNDPKHFALVDGEGSLYPNNLGVDDEYIVAYGDVIVGSSANLSRIESGEELVKVPKPKPWPGEELPYRLGPNLTDDQKEYIVKIGNVLDNKRVIKMRPYNPNKDKAYVYFKKGSSHCYAEVGYTGSVTQVALNEKCGYGEIFHEVFHVLGFFHEQNRFDRDEHIKILWENIDEEHWPQFEKFPQESLPDALQNPQVTPFSFYTFMLYRPTAFSNNSDYSIVTTSGDPYSQILEPTTEDFRRARLLYNRESP